MTDEQAFDDPTTAPFWTAAAEGRFVVQQCGSCATSQLYPRPFCLRCESRDLALVDSPGVGTVYSMTEVSMSIGPDLAPPYRVLLVDLDEGPRFMGFAEGDVEIGDRVRVGWRPRPPGPPLAVFAAL